MHGPKEVPGHADPRTEGHRDYDLRRRLYLPEAEVGGRGRSVDRVRAGVRHQAGHGDRHAAGVRPGEVPEGRTRRRLSAAASALSPAVPEPVGQRSEIPPLSQSRVTVYARTLHRACEVEGGLDALSRKLGVPAPALTRWIGGLEQPPLDKFLAAVDIVLLAAELGRGSS